MMMKRERGDAEYYYLIRLRLEWLPQGPSSGTRVAREWLSESEKKKKKGRITSFIRLIKH